MVQDYIKDLSNQAKSMGCPTCKSKVKQIDEKTFECTKDCGRFVLDPKLIRRFRDSFDSKNWKAKCDECGGVMDYYNFKYGCRKCGNVLDV